MITVAETLPLLVTPLCGVTGLFGALRRAPRRGAERRRMSYTAERCNEQNVALATVSSSAEHARELGYLQAADDIIMHPDELLFVARAQLRALCDSGYRPPIARPIRIAGRTAWANFQTRLVNLHEGGFISDHDLTITSLLARTLTSGDLDPGTLVDEDWLLRQERQAFIELCKQEKTYQRISHTLMTGKPLRN